MKPKETLEALNERLWTAKETAYYLQIPIKTLYQLNYKGTGPKAYTVGKHCRYIPREVLTWLQSHTSGGFA